MTEITPTKDGFRINSRNTKGSIHCITKSDAMKVAELLEKAEGYIAQAQAHAGRHTSPAQGDAQALYRFTRPVFLSLFEKYGAPYEILRHLRTVDTAVFRKNFLIEAGETTNPHNGKTVKLYKFDHAKASKVTLVQALELKTKKEKHHETNHQP